MSEKKLSTLKALVPLKNSLSKQKKSADMADTIIVQIRSLPNFQSLRDDPELLLYACDLVEYLSNEKGVNKQQVVLSAMTEVFNLNSEQQTALKVGIEFLWNNDQITTLTRSTIIYRTFILWMKKKFC
jgi:hypothetical protein